MLGGSSPCPADSTLQRPYPHSQEASLSGPGLVQNRTIREQAHQGRQPRPIFLRESSWAWTDGRGIAEPAASSRSTTRSTGSWLQRHHCALRTALRRTHSDRPLSPPSRSRLAESPPPPR